MSDWPAELAPLPDWACTKKKRRKHIARVTILLAAWAETLSLDTAERVAWIDAGRYHDALRDAPVDELRALAGESFDSVELLHGPAAAARLEREGERRTALLDAIRYHSVGYDRWKAVGKALYMADYLEPGRDFDRVRRAVLAARVPQDFEGTFIQVVRARMAYATAQGFTIYPESAAMLASVR